MSGNISDDAIILHARDWQAADKYVVAFTKNHGKVTFIAYGARYVKNVAGRLLQPFAVLSAEVTPGQKVGRLKGCELLQPPQSFDFKQMAYAAVAAELTEVLTEDREPQPEIFELLKDALYVLGNRNPRITVISYALNLLGLTGFAPQADTCVVCGNMAEEGYSSFSPLQGGLVCKNCCLGGEEPFATATRELMLRLQDMDFKNPESFTVRGENLMELEKLLYKFILFQTDKPLNSINFLAKIASAS